ncbi:MAG: hypothetical protein IT210_22785 [Armatimonadetes bacterium]|nr:hypothetical protein [Armatimonadota bacterium]
MGLFEADEVYPAGNRNRLPILASGLRAAFKGRFILAQGSGGIAQERPPQTTAKGHQSFLPTTAPIGASSSVRGVAATLIATQTGPNSRCTTHAQIARPGSAATIIRTIPAILQQRPAYSRIRFASLPKKRLSKEPKTFSIICHCEER